MKSTLKRYGNLWAIDWYSPVDNRWYVELVPSWEEGIRFIDAITYLKGKID